MSEKGRMMASVKWCRYSNRGVEHMQPRKQYRFGRLLRTGYTRPKSWSNSHPYAIVMWNGLKSISTYHGDFIEVFAETEEAFYDIPELPIIAHLLRSKAWHA